MLGVIVLILFVGNYKICDYFYSTDIESWWILRTKIYSIMFVLFWQMAIFETKGIARLILSIGLGFSFSDVIDRIIFNNTNFTRSDIFMILITITFANIDYVRNRSNGVK